MRLLDIILHPKTNFGRGVDSSLLYIYNMIRFLFVALLLLSVNSFATFVAVLETAADGNAKDSVSFLDRQYLTNVLREQAVKELPAEQNFTIMTRENINAMLPPGKAIEDCEGSCLAETGRNIAADYVCQARVGRFGKSLTLSAELYETAGSKLVTSFNGRGNDVEELLKLIEEKSPAFFHKVKVVTGVASETSLSAQLEESVSPSSSDSGSSNVALGESIPANVNDVSSKKGFHWVPISISAAAVVAGTVLAVIGNNKAKDAYDKGGNSVSQLDKNKSDAQSGQTMRSVGIGIAIAGAVGVGISFAF